MNWNKILIIAAVLAVISGCSKNPSKPDYQQEISIFGYLWGNQALIVEHGILVTYTEPITKYYDVSRAAIRNAQVTLTDEGSGEIYELHDSDAKPGSFYNDAVLIKPRTTYQLVVKTKDRTATAETTVPYDLLQTTELKTDATNQVNQKNLGYEKPVYLQCESEDQIIYVDMFCNEPYQSAEYIYPFSDKNKNPQSQNEYDGGKNGEPRHIAAFMKYSDVLASEYNNQHVIFWYASMIVFLGSNTMQILAIDNNYHKFLYTEHPELNGGIKGGIGVFGSVCGKTYQLQVNGR
jgi:hypothetical protein